MEDVIILTDREEIQDLIGDVITDKQWLTIKTKINSNKAIWQIVDETIGEIVEELA